MMQEVGHPDCTLFELDGHNHGEMVEPAHALLLRLVRRVSDLVDARVAESP